MTTMLTTMQATMYRCAGLGVSWLLAACSAVPRHGEPGLLARVDHVAYATPDLDATVVELEARLGVRAVAGGRHPGLGTRNALLALGPTTYLEIIGPDPEQPAPAGARIFGIDALDRPRLAIWVANTDDIDGLAARARSSGVPLGAVRAGARQRPDGTMLSWRATDASAMAGDGLVPFFIAWDPASPHPATTSPAGCSLLDLRAEHPDPDGVRALLRGVGIDLPVARGPAPALIATLRTPRGVVELR
jgi:hypothetical protein